MSTLTNDLIMGISMLGGMYGEIPSESMMVQLRLYNLLFGILLYCFYLNLEKLVF